MAAKKPTRRFYRAPMLDVFDLLKEMDAMPVKKPTKTEQKVADAFHEVHTNVPSTVKATGKTGKAKEAMLTAVALSKARAAGADIPEKPKGKKSSRASY